MTGNKIRIYLYIYILFLVGCNNNNKQYASKSLNSTDLLGTELKLEGSPYFPRGINQTDSMILILCDKTEKYFTFFSKDNYTRIGSFGLKGNGPGEITMPADFQITKNGNKEYLWILDIGQMIFGRYPIDSLFYKKNILPDKYFFIPPKLGVVQKMQILNDSIIVGVPGNNKGRLFFWYPYRDSIKYLPFYPKIKRKIPKSRLNYSYNSYIGINNKLLRIVDAFIFFDQFDIISSYGLILKSINITIFTEPDLFQKNGWMLSDNTVFYYQDIYCNEDYIFLLYYGHSNYSIENEFDTIKSKIFVFNWEGDFIREFNLDQLVYYFTVDDKQKVIYGVNLDKENPFVKYNYSL